MAQLLIGAVINIDCDRMEKLLEPEQLRRGKEFHRLVQGDWAGGVADAPALPEHTIWFTALPWRGTRIRRGRIDIFIDKIDDFVSVVEIKATNWDAVKPGNRQKLLGSHRRQVLRYVDKYLDDDGVNVCAGIIYPRSPHSPGLKEEVETYLNDHALQVVWYEDE